MSIEVINLLNRVQDHNIPIRNQKLKIIFEKYSYSHVSKKMNFESNPEVYKKIKKSKIIYINKYIKDNTTFLIIVFEKNVIIIEQSLISHLHSLFSFKSNLVICFSDGTKAIFDKNIKIEYNVKKLTFDEQNIQKSIGLSNSMTILLPFFTSILKYLISKSFIKLQHFNRIKKFGRLKTKEKTYSEDDFIRLNYVETGTFFRTQLIYMIDEKKILLIKNPYLISDEIPKLFIREKKIYQSFNHPLIPKFYGTASRSNSLIIEYIKGQTLKNIGKLQLNDEEKIKIIFEIMLIISYFHKNKVILRDLKPNNIMIDNNKTVVFIDFDRAISFDYASNNEDISVDLMSIYAAPDFGNYKISFECDIYSLGLIIYFIMTEKDPILQNQLKFNNFGKHTIIKKICEQCINKDPSKRKNIFVILNIFINHYFVTLSNICDELSIFIDDSRLQLNLGKKYYDNKNIEKAIHFFTLAAKQNEVEAQFFLGEIYSEEGYVSRDILKAINFYTLAANQNHQKAQFKLGLLYHEGKYVKKNIDKAINFYTLAANQNHLKAQLNLANIFCENKNINKAIYYYEYAANNNNLDAQYYLGTIYLENKYIQQNIKKAIYFLTCAAKNNHKEAQYTLGNIYYTNKYAKVEIEKAIYYYLLASNQNHPIAQLNLGLIYLLNQYVPQDINKSIYYFTLSANQNVAVAQLNLGVIYNMIGNDIPKYMQEAIYYFTLAANQNIPVANYYLGAIHYNGKYAKRDFNKIIHFWTLAADKNHCEAQYHLGSLYHKGIYVAKDITKAIHYLTLAANQNDINAQNELGFIYFKGNNISKDINKAIYYFTLAADQNNAYTQYNIALIYSTGLFKVYDINKAVHYFTLAANQNFLEAQIKLGELYYEGNLIQRNIEKSIHYLTLASNQNDSRAQYYLGLIFYEGKYVLRNIKKALYYLTLAANQNYLMAQYNLGIFYYEDDYVEKDINKSIHFFTLASNQNFPHAQNYLGKIYCEGKFVTRDMNKALYYFQLASNQNHLTSQINIGQIYYFGKYVTRDINKAVHYLTLAANQNNAYSCYLLGEIFYEGLYIKQDINKAIHYLNLAANQKYVYSYVFLGCIFMNGRYIPQDIDKAVHYFTLAARYNNSYAMFFLGMIYFKSNNNNQFNNSIHYFKLSADLNCPIAQYIYGIYNYITNINIHKAMYYLNNAAQNGVTDANFAVGFLQHEGKSIKQNIPNAIKHYRKASDFYDQHAKNNLGILYKNGFEDKVTKNISNAIIYFEEGIRFKKDKICMYNLAHIYLYEESFEENLDKSIELLIQSLKQDFKPAENLLCIAIIMKHGFDLKNIIKALNSCLGSSNELQSSIIEFIKHKNLDTKSSFKQLYEEYRTIDYMYDIFNFFPTYKLFKNDQKIDSSEISDITSDFYDGFGHDLFHE